jgi:hypothetical protein
MMIEQGKKYYFIVHAYYHYIAEVATINGKKSIISGRCVQVHSCRRSWTQLFKDGASDDTQFDELPNGTPIDNWIMAIPWHHNVPKK